MFSWHKAIELGATDQRIFVFNDTMIYNARNGKLGNSGKSSTLEKNRKAG